MITVHAVVLNGVHIIALFRTEARAYQYAERTAGAEIMAWVIPAETFEFEE